MNIEDKAELLLDDQTPGKIRPRTIGSLHTFYLSGEIKEPENYIQWFDTIRMAGEHDIIKIHINSPGGDLFSAIQFMRILSESSAFVIASVEGACMSAATLIFMSCDSFEISEHSMFMFHNYSGMTFGKGGEMIDQLQHERKWSEKIFRKSYKGFLTDDEINAILDNKDIWMDGEEVIKRLKKKQDAIEKTLNKKTGVNNNATKTRKKK